MSSSDLNICEKKVDVKIAEEYFRINKEFHSIGCEDGGEILYDSCHNKIFAASIETYERTCKRMKYSSRSLSKSDLSAKFMDLAELVLENVNLFCQLDYLIRKIPIEITRDFEIKLLVQNLIYHSSLEDEIEEASYSYNKIHMDENSLLSKLGFVTVSKVQKHFTIFAALETAVICSVFVELCHKVGLEDYVYLVMDPKSELSEMCYGRCELELQADNHYAFVGIITEKADIDSAIDTFLDVPHRYSWCIEKILVQECVLDKFKERLEWKTQEPSSDVDERIAEIIESCSSASVHEGIIYFFDFPEDWDIDKGVIIESYRTNNELLSLMSGFRTLGVSLWSSDVAESNEIALNIRTNIVWLNAFGYFDGPPSASQAYYISIFGYRDEYEQRTLEREIEEKRIKWNKLDETDRHLKVWKATRTIRADIEGLKLDIVLKCFNNSMTTIGNKICTVITSPILLHVKINSLQDLFKHVNFILRGSAVIVLVEESSERDTIIKYCEELQSCGAPLAFTSSDNGFRNQIRYDRKVIWSSIGTIFAN